MKKLALILVGLIVVAQLAWLSVQYDIFARELEESPHLLVVGEVTWGEMSPKNVKHAVSADDPFFGKSLWWGEEWQAKINGDIYSEKGLRVSRPEDEDENHTHYCLDKDDDYIHSLNELSNRFPERPKPGDEVRGALKLLPGDVELAGFWKKGEDGVWTLCRVEAPNSSEDKAHEDELRTRIWLNTSEFKTAVRYKDKVALEPVWIFRMSTYEHPVIYTLPEHEERSAAYALSDTYTLGKAESKKKPIITLDVAVRAKHPPLIRRAYIDGVPFETAIKDIIQERSKEDEAVAADDETDPEPLPPTPAEQPAPEQPTEPTPEPTPEPSQPAATDAAAA